MELAYLAHEAFGISAAALLTENSLIELEDWSNYNMSAGSKQAPWVCFYPLPQPAWQRYAQNEQGCGTGLPIRQADYASAGVSSERRPGARTGGGHLRTAGSGPTFTCPEIAMASAHCIVTCDRLIEHDDMTRYPNRISIPYFSVDAVIEVPYGAYPGNSGGLYYYDEKHIPEFRNACEKFRKGDRTPLQELSTRSRSARSSMSRKSSPASG